MRNLISNEHKILHHKFVEYGANAKEWMRKCVLLLPKIVEHEIWRAKGFGSIYEYAAKLAGMSRNTVDDALRILRKIEDKPELQKVIAERGLNAVRPVLGIVTKDSENFWAEKARTMSKNTLEVYVREIRTSTENNGENSQQQVVDAPRSTIRNSVSEYLKPTKMTISMELDPEIVQQLQKLKGQGDWNELMKEFLELREQKMEERKPAPVETDERYIPASIKKYVTARTNGTCSFPACIKPAAILHHTQRFALEKIHDPDQIQPLCKAHERLAHLGLIENENRPANFWQVREEADKNEPKYEVDRLVARYRK